MCVEFQSHVLKQDRDAISVQNGKMGSMYLQLYVLKQCVCVRVSLQS